MSAYVAPWRRWWLYLFCAAAMGYLIIPTLIVIPMSFSDSSSLVFPPREFSFRWYIEYFGSPEWRDATFVSLQVACLTTLLTAPLGIAAAYGLHVFKPAFAGLLRGVFAAPLLVPVILFAVAAYYALVQIELANTLVGLVLADSVLTLPFMFITVNVGLASFDMGQEMVARSLGASRLRAFMTVTLPQIKYSIIAGVLFVFITAFDEVVIASMLSAGERSTLTNRMFVSLQSAIDPTIAAICTVMVAITMLPIAAFHLFKSTRNPTRTGDANQASI